jgi:enoyl-CoA hydratase
MKSKPQLILKKEHSIGTIIFSNPEKMNAMNMDMWLAVPQALGQLDDDPEVRVILVKGEGDRVFISGADISQFDQFRDADAAQQAFNDAVAHAYEAPLRCRKTVVASIQGICFGGGLGFAAACDVRICSEDAKFRMPAARLGLGYSFEGIRRFVNVIGAANTADLFASARQFDAIEAMKMGFVSQVHPSSELASKTSAYLKLIVDNAPLTIEAAKMAINESLKDPSDRQMDVLNQLIGYCYESDDYSEGRLAFLEKRQPKFQGK